MKYSTILVLVFVANSVGCVGFSRPFHNHESEYRARKAQDQFTYFRDTDQGKMMAEHEKRLTPAEKKRYKNARSGPDIEVEITNLNYQIPVGQTPQPKN